MRKCAILLALLLIVVLSNGTRTIAQAVDRAEVSLEHIWNLEDVYPSDEAWAKAKKTIAGQFDGILVFKGKLSTSPEKMLACLKLDSQIGKEIARLYTYASMKSDQDTRLSKNQGMKQMMRQLVTDYQSKASFIAPEITSMDQADIDDFIKREPGLKIYKMYLGDLLRTKAHRLSANGEKLLAEAGLIASAPQSIFSIFSNAELPFPEITLSDGTTITLNQAGYARYRASVKRADREAVFNSFFGTLGKFKQTFAAQLSAQINKDMFYARARKYDSSLHLSLDGNNIPVEVYHTLIKNAHENLGSFHRYLRLKQRMLGVKQLKYSDIYAPVVKKVKLEYSYAEAKKLVLEALEPMGQDYVNVVKRSFDERWIDVYPTPGKRVGAYCNGSCYDVHPYMLLNYNGQYDDVSTLAHELGHAMHSHYSNKTQPYPTSDYATFVAEVASTLNEALLIHKVLDTIDDDNVRLAVLMSQLDSIKGTVFRQTQFAEFELTIHQMAEKGEPLTGDVLTEVYGKILKKYYGHDKGVCHIDDRYCVEWSYVPHFYLNFYVYQYATSFTASTALAEEILGGKKGAVQRTMDFLSAGGADYPVDILKKAGVDMTTSEPFDKTMTTMNRIMDQIEEILDRQQSSPAQNGKKKL